MLNYSKRRKPEIASIDVIGLISEIIGSYRPGAESKGIAIETKWAQEALTWKLESKTLRHALENLVGNAIDAIVEKGGSKISITVVLRKTRTQLHLIINDDGPGIAPEIQQRIFDPFFSTKKGKGTGLGLANVKKGVEEHGGRVLLDSEPSAGSTFTLIFPEL